MTGQLNSSNYQLNNSNTPIRKLNQILITLYIYSLFVVAYSPETVFISELLFVAAFAGSFLDFLLTKEGFSADITFFSLLLFVTYACITCFWAESDYWVVQHISTLIQLFGLYVLIRLNVRNERELKVILWAIFVGIIFMCVYTVAFYGIGEIISRISAGVRIGDEINQENGMGLYCTMLSIMSLYYVLYEKRYWCLAVLPLSLFVLVGAASRKSFLLIAVGALVLIMFKSKKGKLMRFFAVMVVFIIAIYFVMEFAESNKYLYRLSRMFHIFDQDSLDDSLATRTHMISLGIQLFLQNPVFGYGPMQFEHQYSLIHGIRRAPHTTYLQVMVSYGSIGTILFYGIYVYFLKNIIDMVKNGRNYSVLMLTMILVFLTNDIGANMLDGKFVYIFFAIYAGYLKMKLDTEKTEGESTDEDIIHSTALSY